MSNAAGIDVCRAWKPTLAGVSEVFHASFTEHAYPRHCHDTWTVLIVDAGAVRYDLDRHPRAASPKAVTVLPPFVAHDGQSARPGHSFHKRVLYVDTDTISEGLIGAAVDRSTIEDAALRHSISRLHQALGDAPDDLEPESLLALIVDRIAASLVGSTETSAPGLSSAARSSAAAEALRAELDARSFERLDLGDLAAELGWHPTHLIRSFTRQYGLPPHRYLISRRLDDARRQLLDGVAPAAVAANVGFHDQAHLGRHFKAHLGVTPGRYRPART